MGEGRGNSAMVAIMVLLCMLVLQSKIALADTYTVGGPAGWSYYVSEWPTGKQFEEGDKFVFNYDPRVHNVVKVTEPAFNACYSGGDVTLAVYQSGNDEIRLRTGDHYFVGGISDDCQRGMKLKLHLL